MALKVSSILVEVCGCMIYQDAGDVMKKIKLTQDQVALVSDIDYEYLMQWKWHVGLCSGGHWRPKRNVTVADGRTTLRIHTVIAERMGIVAEHIDHIDQNSLNNCRLNLRGATKSQNEHNRTAQRNSLTGVKGVYFDKKRGKYRARIQVEGRKFNLGYFDTLAEAANVVQRKRKELVGEFAHD